MNASPIIIEDDDAVTIINDDSTGDGPKQDASTTVDTIILDEEPTQANKSTETNSDKESSFAMLLKNNSLMNKIVHLCLNMSNNAGMSRVINKTLLPLYADANRKFKEPEKITELLKSNLKKIKNDPDHKFLHLKTLCEDLKSGMFRKKVPFVTLSKEVNRVNRKRSFQWPSEKDLRRSPRKRCNTKETKSICKESDIINLDNSDDDDDIRVINDDNGDNNDIMIVDENTNSDVDSEQSNKENSIDVKENCKISSTDAPSECLVPKNNSTGSNISHCEQSNKENNVDVKENYKTSNTNAPTECLVPKNNSTESNISHCEQSNKENNVDVKENYKTSNTNAPTECLVPKNNSTESNISHCEQSNKENNVDVKENYKTSNINAPTECLVPKNNSTESNISHCDLLVPKKTVKPDQHSSDYNRCVAIEQQILLYQEKILQLEEAEVTNNYVSSPYLQCDKYKAKIVQLYKKLCKITGNGDGNLLKQRVVRLQVVEGHPPGPVKRLERFLNNTIDETGVVPLPDLHDVVRCVTQSNIVDRLGWSKQQIMKEAIALFTQCCHALRKSRQRREYKDLMSIVRDRSLDDYDPANEDPGLCAKLEENKIIAKANEEEVLERYVKMEYMPNASHTLTPRLGNMSRLKNAEYTDTESDGELDLTLSMKNVKHEVPDHEKERESATRRIETSSNNNESNINNTKHKNEQPRSTTTAQNNFVNINSIQEVIDTVLKKALTAIAETNTIPTAQTIINTINVTSRDTTNVTVQNHENSTKSNSSNTHTQTQNMSKDTTNYLPNQTSTTSQNSPSMAAQKYFNNGNQIQRQHPLSNTIQKIGRSNRYVVSYKSKDNSEENGLCSDIKLEKRDDFKAMEMNTNTSEKTDLRVKTEDVSIKQEPIDIKSLLDSLGDNYISTIFDIEDPFLVVEISSDSSDDEL